LGTAGSYIAFIHLPLGFIVFTLLDAEDDLFHVPWLFMAMPLGVLSLLFTVISIRKREPKRRSLGNVSRALFAILFYPVALACVYALAQGA
jgi:cytochrome bd-type quinol oxidase subunit 2